MKKQLFLLPLLMLAIAGCSDAGGDNPSSSGPRASTSGTITSGVPGSSSTSGTTPSSVDPVIDALKQKINDFLAIEECQISIETKVDMPGDVMSIPYPEIGTLHLPYRTQSEESSSLVYTDRNALCVDYSATTAATKMYFVYSDVLDVVSPYGLTIDNLKALGEAIPEGYGTVEFNDEEGYAIFTQDEGNEQYQSTVVRYDIEANQYKMADFHNNHPINVRYMGNYEMPTNYRESSHDTMSIFVANLDKVEVKDGVYEIDFGDEPYSHNGSYINKLGFSFTDTTYHLVVDGTRDNAIIETITYHEELSFHHIGNMEYTIPDFAVICPFNHSVVSCQAYDQDHHALVCACCGKLIGEPEEHVYREPHDICLECTSYFFPYRYDIFTDHRFDVGVDMITIHGYQSENGTLYDLQLGNIGYNCDFERTAYPGYSFHYWMNNEILIVGHSNGSHTIEGTEWVELSVTYDCYKGFPDLLSPEQIAYLNEHRDERYDAIYAAFNFPSTYEEFKTQYAASLLETYTGYDLNRVHEHLVEVPFENEDLCFSGSYFKCDDCGQLVFPHCYYHHDETYTKIDTPEWGMSNRWYFTGSDCAHCGAHDDAVYQVDVTPYHETQIPCQIFFANGNYYPSTYLSSYISIPHVNADGDTRCDICGSIALEYSFEGTLYSMFFYQGQCTSASSMWNKVGSGLIDEYTYTDYAYQADPSIVMRVFVKEQEGGIMYTFSINGGTPIDLVVPN